MRWRWPHKAELFMAIAAHATPRCGGTYRIGSVPYENSAVPYAREWRAETEEQGYAVAVVRGPIIKADDKDDLWQILLSWYDRVSGELGKAGRCLGLWFHEGYWHIDCVQILYSERHAIELGRKNRELSIYDLVREKTIFLEESI